MREWTIKAAYRHVETGTIIVLDVLLDDATLKLLGLELVKAFGKNF